MECSALTSLRPRGTACTGQGRWSEAETKVLMRARSRNFDPRKYVTPAVHMVKMKLSMHCKGGFFQLRVENFYRLIWLKKM